MEINIRENDKIVEIWLTNAEKNDPTVQAKLKPLYANYKRRKFTVAVFQSGSHNLYQRTLELLAYNKQRVAELTVQHERNSMDCHSQSVMKQ